MANEVFLVREQDFTNLQEVLLSKETVSFMGPDVSICDHLEFRSLPNLTTAYKSYSESACCVDGILYWFGSNTSSSYYKYAYKYDPKTSEYVRIQDIPYNFYNGCVIAVGTTIYLFGGAGGTTTAYKYDALNDSYEQLANIPTAFQCGSCVIESDKNTIHLMGGTSNSSMHYVYSISENTYTSTSPSMPYNYYYGPAVITPDDTIYIFGSGSSSSYYSYCYCLYKGSTSWTSLNSSSYYTYNGRALLSGKYIYIYGGTSYTRYIQRYNIRENKWDYVQNQFPTGMEQGSLVECDGTLYIFCGNSDSDGLWARDWYKEVLLAHGHKVKTDSHFMFRIVDGEKVMLERDVDGYFNIEETGIYNICPDSSLISIG